MGHLDSQRSLPVIGSEATGPSALCKKLRLTNEHRVAVLNAPDGYVALLHPGPSDITSGVEHGQTFDAVLLFVRNVDELRRLGAGAIAAARANALLWIAYPKSGTTDLPPTPLWVQRDVLGEITSVIGYKPVAFVAVDETWTALRFKKV